MFFQSWTYINCKCFLNILLCFARSECNADRCPSRKCAKYVVSAWFQFWHKQHLRIDVVFFYPVFWMNNVSRGFNWIGKKKALKCNDPYLHLHRISRAPLIRQPDRHLKLENFEIVDIYFNFNEYSKIGFFSALTHNNMQRWSLRSPTLMRGGILVHTEYRCLFFLWYNFF